jgi:non-canonical (house-cleaning) NTP pyrophosphatase
VLSLPPAVVALLDRGMELGHAMDAVARTTGTKHAGGAVGLLTAGLVPLQHTYEMLAAYALSRWLRHGLWETSPDQGHAVGGSSRGTGRTGPGALD